MTRNEMECSAPEENVAAFCLLYEIEAALRELIIEELSSLAGSRWYKQRLPGDVLEKYREAKKFEKSVKWSQLVPHHPMYYTDFSHLKIVIQARNNWDDAFSKIFGNKDNLSATLSELEFIRNKVAHNRKLSRADVEVAKTARDKLATAVGLERFRSLSARCTHLLGIDDRLRSVAQEAENAFHCCMRMQPIPQLVSWDDASQEWWFDESYLCSPTEGIEEYFRVLREYSKLARERGSGYRIESWLKSSGISEKYDLAKEELAKTAKD